MRHPNLPREHEAAPPSHRRRALTLFLVALTAVAVLAASAPVEARGKMVLGISDRHHTIRQFANSADGNVPALWTLWSTWGNEHTKAFPSQRVRDLPARTTPLIFWEPGRDPNTCTDHARLRLIAKGRFDGYIRNWARAAKQVKRTVLVRFAHEINGRFFPWTLGRCGNKRTHYLAAWRHVHDLVRRGVGAKNVKFVWTVNRNKPGRGFGKNPYTKLFPGARYVQYMGFSSFNWGTANGKEWKSMLQGLKSTYKKIKRLSGRPIIVAELASNHVGGDKAAWIRNGYRAVYRKMPRIKGIIYLNVDLRDIGHPNWSLSSPAAAMDAFVDLLEQPRFRGRIGK